MSDYNGWTNYETWNVPLWIDNEYALYQNKVRFLRGPDLSAENVELFVRDLFENVGWHDGTPDMDGAADMDKVNWAEIANHWQDEAEELENA